MLAVGPQDAETLAAATGTHTPSLERLLRALASLGIVVEADGRFSLTPLGASLRAGVPGSVRDWVLFLVGEWLWRSWGDLLRSVRTGEPAFDRLFGMSNFAYWEHNAEAGAIHDAFFTATARTRDAAVLASYDFSRFGTVVDVGGSQGALLGALLAAHAGMRGVLFDLPHVVAGAGVVFEAAGVAERATAIGGDFFDSVPPGGDAYILMQILHDWDDARATAILRACRAAMDPEAVLLVIERVLPDRVEPTPAMRQAALVDLTMLLLTPGGRERTVEQFRALLADAGFTLRTMTRTPSPVSVLEAMVTETPAGAPPR